LSWWLQPAPANRLRSEVLGAGTVVALYALEIWIFLLFR
jgi:hypothetical protein